MGSILEMFMSGGVVMAATKLIILLGSVGAVIIAIERALFLRGFSAKARELHEQVVRALLRGDAAIALHECDRSHVATAALYRAAFDRAQRPDRVADAVDRARREVIQALRAPLWVLGTLGAVMPFVGLFGTVVGILASFHKIGETGQSGFATVAPAISEALITTAGGIGVAVVAVTFYNIFQARIAKESFDLTLRADELAEVVIDHAPEVAAALQSPRAVPSSPSPTGTQTHATSVPGHG
jgi:biopolymer transport protein ExbB